MATNYTYKERNFHTSGMSLLEAASPFNRTKYLLEVATASPVVDTSGDEQERFLNLARRGCFRCKTMCGRFDKVNIESDDFEGDKYFTTHILTTENCQRVRRLIG